MTELILMAIVVWAVCGAAIALVAGRVAGIGGPEEYGQPVPEPEHEPGDSDL